MIARVTPSGPRSSRQAHRLWYEAGVLEQELHSRWFDAVQLAGDVDAAPVRRLWTAYQRSIQRTKRRFRAIRSAA